MRLLPYIKKSGFTKIACVEKDFCTRYPTIRYDGLRAFYLTLYDPKVVILLAGIVNALAYDGKGLWLWEGGWWFNK